jgi:hypothetical protein
MSISEIVDAEYRLHPGDFADGPQRMTIANVSYQGVEQLAPVLHLEGTTKRLVLSPDQVQRLVNLSGTPTFSDWIGMAVILTTAHVDGSDTIGIVAADSGPRPLNAASAAGDLIGARQLAWASVGLLALAALLYTLSGLPLLRDLLP